MRGMLSSAGCPSVREWLHLSTSGLGHGSSGRTGSDVEMPGFTSLVGSAGAVSLE